MNKRIKKKRIKMENKRLCKRYPFLIPRNIWNDKILWSYPKNHWSYTPKYEWTNLDCMPEGWRKAFGEQMCEEIRNALIKHNYLYKYRITQIKEKYGSLRWYDNGAPQEVYDIIHKYEWYSERICLCCGREATKMSLGWVSPLCDRCAKKIGIEEFVEIKEEENGI